jgi:glucose-1-phosphate thymidylyltransferase
MHRPEKTKAIPHEVIGLIPASGQAGRLSPLPFSKELFPIGFRKEKEHKEIRPKVVSHYLLEKMKIADITKAYIIVRNGKWDIPAYWGDGTIADMHLAYLMMRKPFGVPYTLDQAYPFLDNAVVAFGFPDIIFKPDDVYIRLFERLSDTNADLILGLFPVEQPHKWDIVDYDETGHINRILIKPRRTQLKHTWIIAVWTPVFTRFMHNYLSKLQKKPGQNKSGSTIKEGKELFMSTVIQSAISSNIDVESVLFSVGFCIDIGTPDDLAKALHNMHNMFCEEDR